MSLESINQSYNCYKKQYICVQVKVLKKILVSKKQMEQICSW